MAVAGEPAFGLPRAGSPPGTESSATPACAMSAREASAVPDVSSGEASVRFQIAACIPATDSVRLGWIVALSASSRATPSYPGSSVLLAPTSKPPPNGKSRSWSRQ